jgi:eukaryotic-like serine/threonine-protein kinase
MMSPKQQQIEKVFQAALTMDEPERTVFLAEACDDDEMRAAVERLLTGELSENTIAAETTEDRELDAMIGQQIGVYRLARELGRGGMGAVYLAERVDGAFSQKVAVKLIKRGMDTDLVVRRFRNERQILATLNHPNITRLLDGGSTRSGLPYFVMEYVEGEQLYTYCDRQRLGINERLRIFQQICDAIEEAHRHKIIHRDLKPSNILVKPGGTPKLLDFGIAKLLDPEFGATAMEPTATHLRMMTPQYASPEQISGAPVTPASDIYSLGVLLYELLTGHRPYRTKSRAPYEIARAVREEEPTRPSESLTRADNLARSDTGTGEKLTLEVIFAARGATLETLRHELSGNLDKIVLKALRKNPLERYQTAAELSEDLTSYLENRPIKAQEFDAAETIAVAVESEPPTKNSIAILPLKLLGAERSEETGDEYLSVGLADALGSRLSGVKRLTVRPTSSILRYANHADAFQAGRELNVEFIVDGSIRRAGERVRVTVQLLSIRENATRWAESFDEKMTDVLEIEDSISERVVKTLVSHLTGEEQNQLAKRGTNNAEAYEAYLRGRYHWNQFTVEGFAKSLAFYQRAIELAPDYALAFAGIADYYNFLGIYAVRPFAETTAATKKAARQAIAFDPKLAEGYAALGFAAQMGDFDWEAAENYFRQAIELNPNYSIGRVWHAYHLGMCGRFEEAFEQVNRALELDPFTPIIPQTLNWILFHARRYDEAIAGTYRLIEEEPHYGLAHLFLIGVLARTGRYDEAIKVAHDAVALLGRTTHTLCWMASAYAAAGRNDETHALIGEIENLSATQYVSPYLLAVVYANLGDGEKAFELLDKALEIRDGRLSWLAVDPQFDALANDARYERLLRAINHPSVSRKKAPDATKEKEKSIAVLPLKMIGTRNADDEYLGIGLTDALISRLSNIRLFIVRPTSSVLNFKENTDPFAAGNELDVDYVLDGNIRRSGERIRVSIQLLSVEDNSTEWAQSFDEKASDILEFEDLISEQVVKSLVPHLTGEEQRQLAKRATDKAEAYEAYLRGRFNWSLHNEEGFARAIQFYRRAVELDPNYALAYAALTEYYIFLGIHCVIPFAEGAKPAREAAEKAVALDPTLAEGHAVLGFVEITYNWDWDAAEKHLRRAIELNPNSATAHGWLNTVLSQRGRFDDALDEINRVLELDPDSILSLHLQAWVLYHARRFAESIAVHRKMLANEPNYAWGLQTLSWVLRQTGEFQEAVALAEKSVQLTGENPFYLTQLAAAYAAAGEREKTEKILARLAEISAKRFVSEYMLALVYCALKDKDSAFENLEKSLATRDGWLNWLGVDPQFDVLRDDARFADLMRRAGNPLAEPEEVKNVRLDTGGAKSIAVLPLKLFGTPTGAGEDEYLGIGLTDALITRLSNVRRFVMRPTSSVLQYAEAGGDPLAAGKKLAVDYVLDGSIRRSGERIRVSVQLFSVAENANVWAESFDEKSSDVLELEDSISEKVAQSLIPQLTGEERRQLEKRGTNNPEAYEAYLRGRFHWNQFTPDALLKALDSFQKAINLDANYALAYVGLADFFTWANIYGIMPSAVALEKAEAAASRAIELDDQLGEAYAALGLHTQNKQNWDEAERLYHRALELNPNYPNLHEWFAASLVGTGRFAEGIAEVARAEQLDPLSLRTKTLVAWTMYQARYHEESLAKGREIVDMDANYPQGYSQIALNLWATGRYEEAVGFFEKFAAMIPQSALPKYQLCFGYVAVNRPDDARAVLREMQALAAETYVKPYFLGLAYAALGERDEAFAYFEKSQAEFDPWLLWFGTEPMLDPLRDDARYQDLLRRMKLPAIEKTVK